MLVYFEVIIQKLTDHKKLVKGEELFKRGKYDYRS